jgi:ubiquinone/menaquinone biosynthesis C-methylase UbiE
MTNLINTQKNTVEGFGKEWEAFDQSGLNENERQILFQKYFDILPETILTKQTLCADIGCGSGRWAQLVAPKVGTLYLIDASHQALDVAKKNLAKEKNCIFYNSSAGDLPFNDESLDFAYSLGVLHHVPDTAKAIMHIVTKIKPGGYFLTYLYYSFDNRSRLYKYIWQVSDIFRIVISRLPFWLRIFVSQLIAAFVYFPFAKTALLLDKMKILPSAWPLAFYKNSSFYTMRTDALDRFGTRLEHRFSKKKISEMLSDAGLIDIVFSNAEPFWCAVARKK